MDITFIKDFVGNKLSYEVTSRSINGLPPMTDEEKDTLAKVETFRLLEHHYNIAELLEVIGDIIAEDNEEAAEKLYDMKKQWKKVLKNGNPLEMEALAKMFE